MNKKEKTVYEFSAGGVVVDKNKNVLVVRTKNLKGETVYTFPKGHIEKEETPQQAALREVKEETGVEAEIVREIKDVEYWFMQDGKKIHKKVKWYFMRPVKIQQFISDEVDEVLWYNIKEVEKILTYNSDKELIKEIIKDI
ncbi:MAG: NUDIX domain-containing protein [Endomicrobia bacterium]|nr:NUDIX domain-containing protein [Endomicrobiia bacterium]